MTQEFKRYDSKCTLIIHNARVAQEPKIVKEGFMKFSTVLSSANENDIDVWYTVVPQDRDFELAQYLQKGDTLSLEGFPTANIWGESDKMEHVLKFPKLCYPIDLLVKLKERQAAAGGAKSNGKVVANVKAAATKARSRIQLDDDFQDA